LTSPHPHSPAATTPPRRTLITGGAGFIGSHLAERLLARGDHITVVDNLSTGRRQNLPAAHDRLCFIHADLSSALAAFTPDESFDEIYHLAAAVGVKLVMSEPIRSIETNIDQTAALLRFAASRCPSAAQSGAITPGATTTGATARRGSASEPCPPTDTPGIPTLIASSSEVYGKSSKSPFSEEDDAVYGPTTVGRWSYACSKAIDEYLALAYHAKHRLPVVVARFFNTVGPRQVGDYGMVLPRFVAAALAKEPLLIYGDGAASRCFCDVRDVTEVLPRMLANPDCRGRIFNVGTDRPLTILDLADLVIRTLGSSSTKRFLPYSEAFPAGFEDLRQRQPDLARLRAAVPFAPRVPLETTIRDVAAFIESGRS